MWNTCNDMEKPFRPSEIDSGALCINGHPQLLMMVECIIDL